MTDLELEIAIAEEEARIAQMQQAQRAPSMPKPKDEEPDAWYEDFAQGLGYSGLNTYYGIKGLFTDLTTDEKNRLADWKIDATDSGWGKAGEVTGELAQLLIPGGVGLKAAKGLSKLGSLGKLAAKATPFAADVAGSAGLGYVQNPTFGTSRTENALEGAGSAVLGGALGSIGSKLIRGINKTPEARRLLKEGVPLTPGQASESGTMRGVEALMSWAPIVGKGTQDARAGSLIEWNKNLLNKVAPEGVTITRAGTGGFKQLTRGFEKAYNEAWKSAKRFNPQGITKTVDNIVDSARRLNDESRRVLRNTLEDLGDLTRDFNYQKLSQMDNSLRRGIDSAATKKDWELARALKDVRKNIREAAGPELSKKVAAVDKKYGGFMAISKASGSKNARREGGIMRPGDVLDALYTGKNKEKAKQGLGRLRRFAQQGEATVGRQEIKPLLNMRKAMVRNMPSPPGMGFAGRVVLGESAGQKYAQQFADSLYGRALRNFAAPSRLGAAYFNEGD